MAVGSHFGWPKTTFDRIYRHFRSICNFYFCLHNGCRQPFWMTENHFRTHFSPFQINTQLFLSQNGFLTKWYRIHRKKTLTFHAGYTCLAAWLVCKVTNNRVHNAKYIISQWSIFLTIGVVTRSWCLCVGNKVSGSPPHVTRDYQYNHTILPICMCFHISNSGDYTKSIYIWKPAHMINVHTCFSYISILDILVILSAKWYKHTYVWWQILWMQFKLIFYSYRSILHIYM